MGKGDVKTQQQQKAVQKVKSAVRKTKKGVEKRTHKVHYKTRFFRPKTLTLNRTPKYQRSVANVVNAKNTLERFQTIIHPLSTEKAMRKLEDENTMSFLVDIQASKPKIREAFTKLYGGKVRKINTLIRTDGKKKAYIRLAPESDALDIANKIGIL
eukprot:TRINITY_DN235_c0_g1_i2.p1 TRINITY_DN235_c0_g1~~TRINITY_DN235_c0_g1_i2.p1  ORF type:complete len:156 (-),score=34.87 TRINITY_DN235_c0_g1_i2:156-623(-)